MNTCLFVLVAFANHVEVFPLNDLHVEKFHSLEGSLEFFLKAKKSSRAVV